MNMPLGRLLIPNSSMVQICKHFVDDSGIATPSDVLQHSKDHFPVDLDYIKDRGMGELWMNPENW